MPFVYIASPYSHEDATIRADRYRAAAAFTIFVADKVKLTPFSPIVHWHSIHLLYQLPFDFEYFKKMNDDMVLAAHNMYILALDGWRESKGVAHEIQLAVRKKKAIALATPHSSGLSYDITPLKHRILIEGTGI